MSEPRYRISELAQRVDGVVVGDGNGRVHRISAVEHADPQSVVFVDDPRLLDGAARSSAGCVITRPLEGADRPRPRIEVRNPKLAFAIVAGLLHPMKERAPGVHPTAVVAPGATVHPTAHVGPYAHVEAGARIGAHTQLLTGVVVGPDVRIGEGCVLHPHVVLYEGVSLGDRVVLHAGTVIGADGFGYVRSSTGYVKFPQIGTVVIEDDVEVGANSCVDRGALGPTRVGRGSKIDNLVMIAHNAQVGERVVLAGQVGISGSTRIGNDVVMGGQSGLSDHVRLEPGVQVGAKSAVFPGKVVPAGSVVMGIPARPLDRYKQVSALTNRLPRLAEDVRAMRQEMQALREQVETLSRREPSGEKDR